MQTHMKLPGASWPVVGGLLKMAWGAAYAAAATVQPFLRIPGTAGLKHFSFKGWFTGFYLIIVFWAAAERGFKADALIGYISCIAAATLVHQISSRIVRWRRKNVPVNYVGHSLAQVVLRRPRQSMAILLGELLLCVLAGSVCCWLGEEALGHWLALAGLCNTALFWATDPADFRNIELVTDRWANAPASCPHVRRVACRVI